MSIFCPILIFEDEGVVTPIYAGSFLVKPSNLDAIIQGLIEYTKAHTDDEIDKLNKQKEYEIYHSTPTRQERVAKRNPGYVYVLGCEDKYKIGYSTNVERRIQQLDTRPFSLTLQLKVYSERAYDIEQELHKRLSAYKVSGEWYDASCLDMCKIKRTINKVSEDLKCAVQY